MADSIMSEWDQIERKHDEAMKAKARLDWLEKQFEFHWAGGFEDCDPGQLKLVEGNINDRHWRLVGEGQTLSEAIDDAMEKENSQISQQKSDT